jgi:hypothetical protein
MHRAALVALLLAAPARAEDVSGRVLELAGTQRLPSANAFVIVHWTGRRPGFGHYESVCIQAAIAKTDAQGRFAIAEPPPLRSTFFVFRDDPAIAVWKPGFDTQRGEGGWTLSPTKMTREQRTGIAGILRGYGCRNEQGMLVPLADPQKVLGDFSRALETESPTPREQPWKVEILRRPAPNPASR